MTVHRSVKHAEKVAEWEKRHAAGLPPEKLPQLYATAIQAIHARSLATLSKVTLAVVIDRAINETAEIHPSLAEVKASLECFDFDHFLRDTRPSSSEAAAALRELLVVLLNVLGNITADVMTAPLHEELMTVTIDRPLAVPSAPTLRAVSADPKNRGQA